MASITSPFAQRLDSLPVVESRIHADGVNTTYWEYGDPEAETTIIFVHGFRGDHHGLEPFVAFLGDKVRCIVPDLPGFGLTGDFPLGASIDAYASWLISFSTQVGRSSNTIILGHSFGSIVVSAALAKGLNPTKVILVNPIAVNALHGPRGFLTRLAVGYYHVAAALPEKLGFALLKNRAIVRIMSVTMAKTRDKELRAWIHDQHDQFFSHFSTRQGVMEAFETSVSHDVSEFASGITQPVLLLAAEDDDITEIKHQHELAASLANARIEVVPEVGHLIHYEAPEWAAEHILRFVTSD
ncbi:MAG: Lipase 1 precursor [Actinomycetota bacterium]|jgi:pimeloyl-ACP methyl ester carboxylesterase